MAEAKQPANPFLSAADERKASAATSASMFSQPFSPRSEAADDVRTNPPSPVIPQKEPQTPSSQAVPAEQSPKSPTSGVVDRSHVAWLSPRRIKLGMGILGTVLLIILAVGGGYYWWSKKPESSVSPRIEETPLPITDSPNVLQEPTNTQNELLEDSALYRSENFKVGEVVLLGEAQFLSADEGVAPLAVEDIRGEAFTEKNKKEVKLVISWKTNKLSQAEIQYAKGIGQTPKTVSDDDLAYNHSLVLSGLDPASTYLYTIKATDRFGNIVTSEPYAVFTGARSVSLFDLIAGAIGDVFGWAVK